MGRVPHIQAWAWHVLSVFTSCGRQRPPGAGQRLQRKPRETSRPEPPALMGREPWSSPRTQPSPQRQQPSKNRVIEQLSQSTASSKALPDPRPRVSPSLASGLTPAQVPPRPWHHSALGENANPSLQSWADPGGVRGQGSPQELRAKVPAPARQTDRQGHGRRQDREGTWKGLVQRHSELRTHHGHSQMSLSETRTLRSWERPSERHRRTGGRSTRKPGRHSGRGGWSAGPPPLHDPGSFPRPPPQPGSVPSPCDPFAQEDTHCHTLGWTGTTIWNPEAGVALPAVSASGPLAGLACVSWTAGGPEGGETTVPA